MEAARRPRYFRADVVPLPREAGRPGQHGRLPQPARSQRADRGAHGARAGRAEPGHGRARAVPRRPRVVARHELRRLRGAHPRRA